MPSDPERSSLLPPYAAPVASAPRIPRGPSAPYVPPSWRTAESQSVPSEAFESSRSQPESVEELPWIDAFADDSFEGAAEEPIAAEAPSPSSHSAAHFVAEDDAFEGRTDEQDEPAAEGVSSETATPDDAWAIADVSEHIARLAEELAAASKNPVSAPTPMPPMPAVSHTPWHDDDAWMDIMPALPNSGARDMAAETEWARAFGEPPAPMTPPALPTGDAQAAALALESIARRLRSGELQVPGFIADRGDAAALAAALASLLGARP